MTCSPNNIGGGVTHMFSHPANERYHPAGLPTAHQ
jgi:hypothetical protein